MLFGGGGYSSFWRRPAQAVYLYSSRVQTMLAAARCWSALLLRLFWTKKCHDDSESNIVQNMLLMVVVVVVVVVAFIGKMK